MRILAVIPARGGSKGIPNKNLAKLGNYSLVAIAVKNALNSLCFTKVHVSTDSQLIQEEAIKYNADCSYLRPAEISTDNSSTYQALEYCLLKEKELGNNYDAICELQPTYVFRGSKIIVDAINIFKKNQKYFNSLLTISKIDSTAHPNYILKMNDKCLIEYGKSPPESFNRHTLSSVYSMLGILIISKTDVFLKTKSLFNNPTFGFHIKDPKNLWDINQINDLEIARSILDINENILFE